MGVRFSIYRGGKATFSPIIDVTLAWAEEILPGWKSEEITRNMVTDQDYWGGAFVVHLHLSASTPQRQTRQIIGEIYRRWLDKWPIHHPGSSLRNRLDRFIADCSNLTEPELGRQVLKLSSELAKSRTFTLAQERELGRKDSIRGRRGKKNRRKRLPSGAYLWLREEWSVITRDENAQAALFERYEERRESKRWPPAGPSELMRYATSASYKKAIRTQ